MTSSSLTEYPDMLIYYTCVFEIFSPFLFEILCKHYVCGCPWVQPERTGSRWNGMVLKDTEVQYFLRSLCSLKKAILSFCIEKSGSRGKRGMFLGPLSPPAPQAFSKQVCSPAKRLCEISCHTCVKTRVQGIIEGNRAIYKLLTDCFNGYDSCKV